MAVVWLCTGRVVFLLFSSVACVVALVVRSSSKQFAVEVSCVGGADVVLCGLSVVAMLCRGRCMQRFPSFSHLGGPSRGGFSMLESGRSPFRLFDACSTLRGLKSHGLPRECF